MSYLLIISSFLALILASPSPPAITSCTVGNNIPCLPSSTCTPTMISTSNQPWLGQCIATLSAPIISATPPILTITALPTPTECNVGWENQCGSGSTCTPTMTCNRLRPCGGKCIATSTPNPPSATGTCNVGWENQCGGGSTCMPIETCYRLRPCRGSCIATPTAPGISAENPISWITPTASVGVSVSAENPISYISAPIISAENPISYISAPVISAENPISYISAPTISASNPILTVTAVLTPNPYPKCTVGWDRQCDAGSTCTPTQTCARGRRCGGACIATVTATGGACE